MTKIAIIAAGFIAHNHAEGIVRMPDVQLAGVVEVNEEKGRAFAEEYGTRWYPTLEALLEAEGRVDIADICLPTNLHEEYVLKCADLGLHVLCERPCSLKHETAEHMLAACRQAGVKLMVAQVLRFWPEYEYIRECFRAGELGEIELAHLSRLEEMPGWSAFYDTPEASGGGLYDVQLHDIDFVYHLFGPVEQVYGVGYRNAKGAWNNVTSTLTFRNGTKAVISAAQEMSRNYPFSMHCRLLGTKGTVEFTYSAGELLRGEAVTGVVKYLDSADAPQNVTIPEGDGYYNEVAYFVKCVREDREPEIAPPEEAVEVIRIIEAIRRSLETGEVVKLS